TWRRCYWRSSSDFSAVMPSRSRRNTDDTSADLDRCCGRVVLSAPDRVRADPLAPAARALRVVVAAHRARTARAVALAQRPEHDRRLVRRADVPAGHSRRRGRALHPRRAAAVLDCHLAAVRPEHDSGPTPCPARATGARGGAYGVETLTGELTT